MNTLDIILLVLLLIAAAAGWRKGIIVQACGIAGLVLGILFAMRFSRTIGRWLGAGDTVSPVLGFILILETGLTRCSNYVTSLPRRQDPSLAGAFPLPTRDS